MLLFCVFEAAGAIGEEDFKRGFDDCPSIGPMSAHSFEEEMVKVEETLSNTDLNWELRATAVSIPIFLSQFSPVCVCVC